MKIIEISSAGDDEGDQFPGGDMQVDVARYLHGDCVIFALAVKKLTGAPVIAVVEHNDEMNSTVLIHCYNNVHGYDIDASGITNLDKILSEYPNNGSAWTVQLPDAQLIKLNYGSRANFHPNWEEALDLAMDVIQDLV